MKNKCLVISLLLTFSITTSANEENTPENNEDSGAIPPIFLTCDPYPHCDGDTSQSFFQWSFGLITAEKISPIERSQTNKKSGQ